MGNRKAGSRTKICKKNFEDLIKSKKEYELRSEYVKTLNKVKIYHKICGKEFYVTPKNFEKGTRCPYCSHGKFDSKNNFEELIKNEKGYNLLTEYENSRKKVKILHEICGTKYEVTPNNFKKGTRCPYCSHLGNRHKSSKESFLDLIKRVPDYQLDSPYNRDKEKVKILHKKCEKYFYVIPNNFKFGSRCPHCSLIGTSKLEKEFQNWLSSLVKIDRNKKFYENSKYKYEIDVFIPEQNIGIEFDGIYWHSELSGGKDKNYHLKKTKWFQKKGITLIHIFDNEWNQKKDLVKSYIKSRLGLISEIIYARKCNIKEVCVKEKNKFLNENHLQGEDKSNIKLGLYFNEKLISLITFGKPRFNKNYDWELIRFCNKTNISIIGGFSRLMKYFIKNYNPKSIISYSDKRLFDGTIYKSNNFKAINESKPNYFYTKDYINLYSRVSFQKHKLHKKLEHFNPNLTEWDNMKNNGYDRIWDCGNKTFVFTNI